MTTHARGPAPRVDDQRVPGRQHTDVAIRRAHLVVRAAVGQESDERTIVHIIRDRRMSTRRRENVRDDERVGAVGDIEEAQPHAISCTQQRFDTGIPQRKCELAGQALGARHSPAQVRGASHRGAARGGRFAQHGGQTPPALQQNLARHRDAVRKDDGATGIVVMQGAEQERSGAERDDRRGVPCSRAECLSHVRHMVKRATLLQNCGKRRHESFRAGAARGTYRSDTSPPVTTTPSHSSHACAANC